MNPSRLGLILTLGCSLLLAKPLVADDAATVPFVMAKQFSADQVISANGMTLTNKFYTDNGKVRTDTTMGNGMQVEAIILPDQKKIYSVMAAQKMIMEMPYDPEKIKRQDPTAAAADGAKFETVGPDTVEGGTCTKYKMTTKDGKVYFMWADDKKTLVKMSSEDGAFSMIWKNYKVGPQDPALFVPPADYKVMQMPGMPTPATPPPAPAPDTSTPTPTPAPAPSTQ